MNYVVFITPASVTKREIFQSRWHYIRHGLAQLFVALPAEVSGFGLVRSGNSLVMHEFTDLPLQGSTLDFLVFPEHLDLLHHPPEWSLKESFDIVFSKVCLLRL